ncbi:UNKNOWN [Stylonychia lemnae]|uniref:PHR domain-containing protein n=1 Tax=Stylonychia lemnae TaxID=5949 RepID=A0A078AI04_STYLE|nr:UNKNOWN [Stylonychia lemnae]|eukprot:CDW80418.1 UNKNOWN [Stylonychia lemnae]
MDQSIKDFEQKYDFVVQFPKNYFDKNKVWKISEEEDFVLGLRYHDSLNKKDHHLKISKDWKDKKIIRKFRSEVHSKEFKPGMMAFHTKYRYILLSKDNNIEIQANQNQISDQDNLSLQNTWQCKVYKSDAYYQDEDIAEDDSTYKYKEHEVVNILLSELIFQFEIETICLIEHQYSAQKHRVRIQDSLSSIIKTFEKLHDCQFQSFFKGRLVSEYNSFAQENIGPGDQILLNGSRNSNDQSQLKFFQRFKNVVTDLIWNLSEDEWSAIQIKSKVDFYFCGIGIFERYEEPPEKFNLRYSYQIYDINDDLMFDSEIYEELVIYNKEDINELHFYKYKFKRFPNGIFIEAGQTLQFMQIVDFQFSYFSSSGADYSTIQNPDMDIFQLTVSNLDDDNTTVEEGLIPGFLYRLA